MSSPFLKTERALATAALLGTALMLAGCDQPKTQATSMQMAENGPQDVAVSGLFPGGGKPPAPDNVGKTYEGNTKAISEGEHLFNWYNCSGCHFHGAGGIGPALMDDKWIYGDRIDQIYSSIYQGRPNGMPAWGGKLSSDQIWMLAAYVKSMSEKAKNVTVPAAPPPAVPGPATLETDPGQSAPN